MGEMNLNNAEASNLTGVVKDYSVDSATTDGAGDQKETTWTNESWGQYLGYFKEIPELNSSINAKATWTIGKGILADPETTLILDQIRGWGKDTFNTIIENMIRTYYIGGDAFTEIIRDEKGNLINLKPLDPSTIRIVANRQGVIIRYEQMSKVKKPDKRFEPEDIFHLARNRVADEIHGVSIIDNLETIILMRNEAMADLKTVMHRHVSPINIFNLDTDDTSKIASFKAKADAAVAKGENLYIPLGTVEMDRVSLPQFSTLNPLPWIDALNQYFFQATGVPDIIVGSAREFTEASAKIAYLAFQQTIEEEQLFVEEQMLMQLGLQIELEFPASLENELLSDKAKDGEMAAAQPNDTTAEGIQPEEGL